MSSRKRKKAINGENSAADGGETEPAATQESAAPEATAVEELEPSELTDPGADGEDARGEVPAISSINELRPRAHVSEDEPVSEEHELAPDEEAADGGAPESLPPAAAPATRAHLKRVIESLIFVSDQIITAHQVARIVKAKLAEVRELIDELRSEYEGRGIELVEVAGGFQFRSAAASAPFVRDLVSQRPVRLTRAQVETMALIAYRQPITRPEIDDVRGVDSGSAIKVLLERDLIKILGRKDEAGRPLLYGTSAYFLEFFGMKGMQDLPTLREFTELNQEHRELFQRKTGEIPDLSQEAESPLTSSSSLDEDEDESSRANGAAADGGGSEESSGEHGEHAAAEGDVEAAVDGAPNPHVGAFDQDSDADTRDREVDA